MKFLLVTSWITVLAICNAQHHSKKENEPSLEFDLPDARRALFMRRADENIQSSSGSSYNYSPGSTATYKNPSKTKFNVKEEIRMGQSYEYKKSTQDLNHSNSGGISGSGIHEASKINQLSINEASKKSDQSQDLGSHLPSHSLTEIGSSKGYVKTEISAQGQSTTSLKGGEEHLESRIDMFRNQFPQSSSVSSGDREKQFSGYEYPAQQNPNPKAQQPVEKEAPRPKSQVQIHRHVYFHAAPEEPVVQKQHTMLGGVTRRKHYTIIFIDTSRLTKPPPQQQQLLANKSEEKTIIYVLVKKPNEQSDPGVQIKTSSPPTKPEVFFINYKEGRKTITEMPIPEVEIKQQGSAPYPPKMDPPHNNILF